MYKTSAWSQFKATTRQLKSNWRLYLLIVAVVAVPTNLISLSGSMSSDPVIESYVTLASLFMTVAVIWAIVTGTRGIRRNYYESSAALLRFILVVAVLAIFLIPGVFGLGLLSLALSAAETGINAVEIALVSGVATLLALPSLYLIVRYGLSIYAVIEGLWPIAALRQSSKLTRGHFWGLARREALLIIWLVLLLLPISIVLLGLAAVTGWTWVMALYQIALTVISLPIIHIYLSRIYMELKGE